MRKGFINEISKLLPVLLLGLIMLITACANEKSATKYFNKHDEVASGYCASKYPVHVGEPKVSEEDWSDSGYSYQPDNQPETNIDGCPIIHDTLTRTINHYKHTTDSIPYIDSALAHNLRLQLGNALQTNTALQNTIITNNKAANAKYEALGKSKKMWMWIAIGLGAAFLGFRVIWLLIKRVFSIFT